MVRYAVALTSMLMLLGCASTAKWQHPMAPNEDADTMTIALAECESYAAGMTPMPKFQGYMPIPSPTSYTTTGTLNTYGNYHSFQASTTPNSGFAGSYAAGANMGADIANAFAAAAARKREEELTKACMRKTGWIDTSTPEGEAQFKKAVDVVRAESVSREKQKTANEQEWTTAIQQLIQSEASRPGGINYKRDTFKQTQFDLYIGIITKDPKNQDKSPQWFVREAHEMVLQNIR